MTRYGRGTAGGSGGGRTAAPAGPMRMDDRPRAGVQVIAARAPRIGPSAAEIEVGAVPPIRLAEEAGLPIPDLGPVLSDTARRDVSPGVTSTDPSCFFCARSEESDLLVQAPGAYRHVCSTCVEFLVDAVKTELPRRRLRLAMERLAQQPVSQEMLEQIERLAATQPTEQP